MLYYFLYGLVYLMSLLPLAALYVFSTFVRFLLFDVFKYRRGVVEKNLKQAFPTLDDFSRKKMRREFEQGFCDLWVEMLKLLSISKADLHRRMQCDWSLFAEYERKGISCNVLLGHQFNWEWANAVTADANVQRAIGLYLPQKPAAVDRLIKKIRSRAGTFLIDATTAHKTVDTFSDRTYIKGLIADQVPANLKRSRWYHFLGAPCPFMTGPEWTAATEKSAVVFMALRKVRRGYYSVTLTEISKDASKEIPGYITDRFVALLEAEIRYQPANWLWTHRRWKRALPEDTEVFSVG